jgi:hypothetical protein
MEKAIRIKSYSAGERLQILELCMLHIVSEKAPANPRLAIKWLTERVNGAGLGHRGGLGDYGERIFFRREERAQAFDVLSVLYHLCESGFMDPSDIVTSGGPLTITNKGKAYMKQCSKRVRSATSKISCDVLDQIVEAIR